LSSDAAEQHNLFRNEPTEAKALLATLENWLASAPKYLGKAKQRDERVLERLRTLGYIQ
jgi:hypothetical protein